MKDISHIMREISQIMRDIHVSHIMRDISQMDGIMHKWANPHYDYFEKKNASQYRIKRIKTN